jgi:hypothetical protein
MKSAVNVLTKGEQPNKVTLWIKEKHKTNKKTREEVSPFATTYYCHSNYTTATLYCTTTTTSAKEEEETGADGGRNEGDNG